MRKSILFVNPDFHCSFILRDEFRKIGWKADVFIPLDFPEQLLYKNEGLSLIFLNKIKNRFLKTALGAFFTYFYLFYSAFRYKYFLIYGHIDFCPMPWEYFLKKTKNAKFRFYHSFAKMLGVKMIYFPSGCVDTFPKAEYIKFDNGNVCDNCGWAACDEGQNMAHLNFIYRYADLFLAYNYSPNQPKAKFVFYKSLDFKLWNPEIEIPEKHRLPKTENLRILHSFYNKNREHGNKNIKGSPIILKAIERLKAEGYPVEYFYVTDVPTSEMRFYQVQADIIVEQIILGWWGSTGMETMTLGKPVICYLRLLWKQKYLEAFPQLNPLPIIEADASTIYEVLKKTVTDKNFREQKAKESLEFAHKTFDVTKNVPEMEKLFLGL